MDKNVKISLLLDIYGKLLTEKQFEMLNDYYNNDLSLGEVAENTGITRQAVRDNLLKGEKNLNEYEQNLGLLKKSLSNQKLMDKLKKSINQINKEENINNIKTIAYSIKKDLQKLEV